MPFWTRISKYLVTFKARLNTGESQKFRARKILVKSLLYSRLRASELALEPVFHFYVENYKTLLKETTEGTNKWKDIHIHGLEDLMLRYQYCQK